MEPAFAGLATQIETFVRLLAHAIELLVLSCIGDRKVFERVVGSTLQSTIGRKWSQPGYISLRTFSSPPPPCSH